MHFAPIPLAATPGWARLRAAMSWLPRGVRRFRVNSRVLRIGTQCAKGYDLADFTDAFARFLNRDGDGGASGGK